MTDPSLLIAITLVFVAAGMVKGALGLGLPTIGMGLLGLFVSPATAAGLLLLPSFLTNAWQALDGRDTAMLLRRLSPMLAAIFVSTLAFSPLLARGDAGIAAFWLGVALAAYGISGLINWHPTFPPKAEPWTGIVIGTATGLVTGATGVFVLPAVPYLTGIGMQRDRLVQAMGMSFTVSTLALGLGLFLNGAVTASAGWGSVAAILPALLGMKLGAMLRARISATTFRRLFFLLLMGLGLHAILRGLG
ncbi:sulfite exporter TauE/SafE family protein [Paracoccus caeni]|uniref:Probable membrane transporter protein n=1 Tax=Paracoccus caeni TaxID=657651 RepID=A0A934SCE0_9RHOB|nr:sulfite exporter TauE/SafE family protein [Paracoccus caeni]MBK4214719.1 sulfite exporter TauE/SafE family protein [Paracoccus caeni]